MNASTSSASGFSGTYVPFQPRTYKLGKAPAKHDVRTVRLEPLSTGLPAPPVIYTDLLTFMQACGMLGNDSHGDCVIADDGHDIILWNKRLGIAVVISDAQALAFYGQASLALNHSSADSGLVMLDFLKWRMKNPWPAPINRPLTGFGTFDHRNHTVVQQLIVALNSVRLGLALPMTAQQQQAPGGTWTLVSKTGSGAPGTWGGHDVPLIGYDAAGPYCVTWGGVQHMTWDFFDFYCDESYGVIPTDPIPGFDLAGFIAELKSIGAYYGPDAPTPPSPPPVPPAPPAVVTATGVSLDLTHYPLLVGVTIPGSDGKTRSGNIAFGAGF